MSFSNVRLMLPRSAVLWLLAALGPAPSATLRATAPSPATLRPSSAARAGRATAAAMVSAPAPSFLNPFWAGSKRPEVLREGGTSVDFTMETLGITKRRVSGGVLVDASPEAIWEVITAYEQLPDVVPNILSNVVKRDRTGRVTIQQESLLSTRMNLRTSMTLDVIENREAWQLVLRRRSGHGFLEFEGKYVLKPRPGQGTYLSYSVELVPCPIFPLPLVERKIRKEVPKMLAAVSNVARTGVRSRA
mgnify:CR=1 FL=1